MCICDLWLAPQRGVRVDEAERCLAQVAGEVTYNGVPTDQFVMCRTAAYVGQTDNHIAELTVRIFHELLTQPVQLGMVAAVPAWPPWALHALGSWPQRGGRSERCTLNPKRCNCLRREPLLGVQLAPYAPPILAVVNEACIRALACPAGAGDA